MPDNFFNKQSKLARALCLLFLCLWCALLLLPGCDKKEDADQTAAQPTTRDAAPEPITETIREAWSHYHIHGVEAFAQPVACVGQLKEHTIAFLKTSEPDPLQALREQLTRCQSLYQASRLFVAADPQAQQTLNQLHQQINAPLTMPGFVDAVPGYAFSGIVNDTSLPISKETLLDQHGLTAESDVSLGFSVLEFLLWGDRFIDPNAEPRSNKQLTAIAQWETSDYELGMAELDIKEHPINRRRRYLELAVLILEEHLNQLATTWNKHTLPPLNMAVADQLQAQINTRLRQLIKQPEAAKNTTLLKTAVSLLSANGDTQQGSSHLRRWLALNNATALAIIKNEETPLTAKWQPLQQLLDIPGDQPATETTPTNN